MGAIVNQLEVLSDDNKEANNLQLKEEIY